MTAGAAMLVRSRAPDPRLRGVVRAYTSRDADLRGQALRIALPARPEVLLEFYFRTPHLVEVRATGERAHAPLSVAVGPQSFRRVDLILSGGIEVFTVRLAPTGLHALFGVSMPEFADAAVEADHLFGPAAARALHGRLAREASLEARAALMDAELLARLPAAAPCPIAHAVARMRLTHGRAPVAGLAAASGLSPRHFGRLFARRVGLAPKTYARVLRLDAALAARAAEPDASWTDLAHRFGWYDQAHMDKDFRALAADTPTGFVARAAASDPY